MSDPARMIVRFDIRPDADGWSIFDRTTGDPAVVEGVTSIGLTRADADDIADLLNTLELMTRRDLN